MAVGYAKSCLIGAIMESMAYGLYLTFFLRSVQVLRRKLVNGPVFIYLTTTTFLLFVLITMRMVLDNKAAVEAFTNDTVTPNAAEIYFTSFGNGAMFRTGTYIALTIVADIFVVYRVFAVWSRNIWITLIPFLLAVADIVSGALVLRTIRHLQVGSSPNGNDLATDIMIFYGFTLGLNLVCTVLIGVRFYIAQRQAAESKMAPSMNLTSTLIIVIESAALYSICLIAMIVPTALGDNSQYCLLSMMPGIVGLAFSLVIVRIGNGKSPNAISGPGSSLRFVSQDGTADFTATVYETQTDYTQSQVGGERNKDISVRLGNLLKSRGTTTVSRSTNMTQDVEKDARSENDGR